jgi:hypothetical protein
MRGFLRWTALAVALSVPALVLPTSVASGTTKPGAKQLIVIVSPNPAISASASTISGIADAIIEVSGVPKYAGHSVSIFSTGLSNRCSGGVTYESLLGGSPNAPKTGVNQITVVLDAKANATVSLTAISCKLGSYLIKATLDSPPYASATTRMLLTAPSALPSGITAGPPNEVATGDGGPGEGIYGVLDVSTVFMVGTGAAGAGQTVELSTPQLIKSCGLGYRWESSTGAKLKSSNNSGGNSVASTVADSLGNAVFIFKGASCAAGTSAVSADVVKGATFNATYTVASPISKL